VSCFDRTIGKFILPRLLGEQPILARTPINNAVSADFCSSAQCAANAVGDRRRGDRIGAMSLVGANAKCRLH
jgi:hypothetical protein